MNNIDMRKKRTDAAMKRIKADLVIKNASILNVFTNDFESGDIAISDGYIVGIGSYSGEKEVDAKGRTVVPGFINSHMHLESSIVSPIEYCKAALPHGTTAIIVDPHEIANVCGRNGIDYILETTANLPIDVYVMVPSCVPATAFDENGFIINSEDVRAYIDNDRVLGLAEMMNYPGVCFGDEEVIKKLDITIQSGKIIDGHAPGLSGDSLNAYAASEIYSDHECTGSEEAIEKIKRGQWIMVREGTASKNVEKLIPVFDSPYCARALLATDDLHPGEIFENGDIAGVLRKAIALGANRENAYKMATFNAAQYFGLKNRGAICPGYIADLVILNDYNTVDVHSVYKHGKKVSERNENGEANVCVKLSTDISNEIITAVNNTVKISRVSASDFELGKKKTIGIVAGEIITTDEGMADCVNVSGDILKLAVVERHHNTGHIGLSYVKGYGLKAGAVATSVAHDSHNIIVVGENDEDMAIAVNRLNEIQGGMVVVNNRQVVAELKLPIAGLMSELSVEETQVKLDEVKTAAYELGASKKIDPFMTLSFLSLPVIPELKLTTLGLFDVNNFKLI